MTTTKIDIPVSKILNVYKKPDDNFRGYYSINVEHPFAFQDHVTLDSIPSIAKEQLRDLMGNCSISAVYFRDEENNTFELKVLIPFSKIMEEYGLVYTLSGEYTLREKNIVLSFFGTFTLTVAQTMYSLMGMFTMLSGVFPDNDGWCGKTSDGKRFRMDSIRMSINADVCV